eukprot:764404-Hanusia_phi.AAC.3
MMTGTGLLFLLLCFDLLPLSEGRWQCAWDSEMINTRCEPVSNESCVATDEQRCCQKHQDNVLKVSCCPCPAGTFEKKSYSSAYGVCVACPPGTFSKQGGECFACDWGKYSSAGATVCTSCEAGKFRYWMEGSVCNDCPIGKFSLQTGARWPDVCTDCRPGTYSNTSGSSTCSECEAGKFSTTAGAASIDACSLCPVGKTNYAKGSVSCSAPLSIA